MASLKYKLNALFPLSEVRDFRATPGRVWLSIANFGGVTSGEWLSIRSTVDVQGLENTIY